MAKYEPLAAYLADMPSSRDTVSLTFADIAAMVGGLPPSAYKHRAWWGNDSKVEARAWRSAGWHVAEGGVDLRAQTVRFARGKVGGPPAAPSAPRGAAAGAPPWW